MYTSLTFLFFLLTCTITQTLALALPASPVSLPSLPSAPSVPSLPLDSLAQPDLPAIGDIGNIGSILSSSSSLSESESESESSPASLLGRPYVRSPNPSPNPEHPAPGQTMADALAGAATLQPRRAVRFQRRMAALHEVSGSASA